MTMTETNMRTVIQEKINEYSPNDDFYYRLVNVTEIFIDILNTIMIIERNIPDKNDILFQTDKLFIILCKKFEEIVENYEDCLEDDRIEQIYYDLMEIAENRGFNSNYIFDIYDDFDTYSFEDKYR